jgi:hypothetical protein
VKFEEITEQTVETTKLPETSEDPSSAEISDGTETSATTEVAVTPPKTIEQKAYIANLPEGYYAEEASSLSVCCTTNFYNKNNELRFCLFQTGMDDYLTRLDTENEKIVELRINENIALLLEDTEQTGIYTLLWTDGIYGYTLYGMFGSLYDMLEIASSVVLEN